MARATIIFGLALCAATVLGLLTLSTERIMTIFVPMIFGIPIFITGVISLNPHRRRMWVRLATVIAFIGILCSAARAAIIVGRVIDGDAVPLLPLSIAISLALALLIYAVPMHRTLRRRKREGIVEEDDSPSQK